MGPKYNVATGREELGNTISYWRSKRHSKRARVPNPAQAAKLEPFAPHKRRQGTSIPSIYVQRLPMGPKYNVATGREELNYTISYWRSKRHSKRARVPNLAQAAKSEPFVPVPCKGNWMKLDAEKKSGKLLGAYAVHIPNSPIRPPQP